MLPDARIAARYRGKPRDSGRTAARTAATAPAARTAVTVDDAPAAPAADASGAEVGLAEVLGVEAGRGGRIGAGLSGGKGDVSGRCRARVGPGGGVGEAGVGGRDGAIGGAAAAGCEERG